MILAATGRNTQHRLAVAITDAYFIAAKNISDANVLADIAADYGFDRDQARAIALDPEQHRRVEQEAAKSADAGVRSVPHFVFGGGIAINGGRSEDEIAAAIHGPLAATLIYLSSMMDLRINRLSLTHDVRRSLYGADAPSPQLRTLHW